MTLTDEQCDEFRRLPCSFRDMIRSAYAAGQREMRERAAAQADVFDYLDNSDSSHAADRIGKRIRALPLADATSEPPQSP